MTNTRRHTSRLVATVVIAALLAGTMSCGPYFNTFFNARKSFNQAEKTRKSSASGRGGQGDYKIAIEKARKVVDDHPNSKYYDDALFILGVSYFHTNEFSRSERRLRELLANYPDSKFARESRLYLARAKLELNDIDDAMVIFEDILQGDYERRYKADAAMALGENRLENGQYELSRDYFRAVRDSLGSRELQRRAQLYIADSYYEMYQFGEALGDYLQALGMDPTTPQQYHALFRAAECSYRLLKIEDGIAYLEQLMENELYYDSLSVLKLMEAQGYEYEDDMTLAEATYEEVAQTASKGAHRSEANYRLGLIYQFDYDDLAGAKSYYDAAVQADRATEWGRDALQRSSDIGKLDTYARTVLDTAATQEQIDDAAYTQYQLSELYWFKLNKPDTAILEMQYLVDSFANSYHAPKAMVALSGMYREYREDAASADSIAREMLRRYPHSDFVPEALGVLGLIGSAADTGYAELYFTKGEDFLIDEENYDSSKYYFQYVVDNFPKSRYHLQARFNIIYLDEMYNLPGDSSVIFAYMEIRDSFPGTDQARWADDRLRASSVRRRPGDQQDQQELEFAQGEDSIEDTLYAGSDDDFTDRARLDPEATLWIGPDGENLVELQAKPIEIQIPFEFPTEAYNMPDLAIQVNFQILVDFSGEVLDLVLKTPTQYEEINVRATETLKSSRFDPLKISELVARLDIRQSEDGQGYWLVYRYLVEKPEFLR
jgi:TolA-binding protein